jgi:hypothetical protein
MSTRKLTLGAVVSLCMSAVVLALGSAAAQATVTHDYLSSITEVPAKGPPPGEEPVARPGPFQGIINLAVDSGELYVDDNYDGGRLDKFNASTGAFIAQFPKLDFGLGLAVGHGTGETEMYLGEGGVGGRVGVFNAAGKLQGTWNGSDTPAGSFGCFECAGYGSVAVDNSGNLFTKGLVYVQAPEHNVVDVFEPEAGGGEKYLTQITGPEPGVPFASLGATPASLAVDQANGDVLVVDGGNTVDVLEPTALGEYALAARLTGTPAALFGRITSVAADGASGDIYVSEESGVNPSIVRVVDQFTSAGVFLGHLTGTSSRLQDAFGAVSAVAVDPATGDVYVGDTQESSTGTVTSVHIFGPSIVIPDVTTTPASSVKPRSATLNGTVNPDEAGAATCRFEWGTSTSFGQVAPCEPEGVADGNSPEAVHAALSGLQPDTTYFYRLRASNANGTNPGEAFQDQEFHTPGPGIHQEAASVVTSVSSTLNALIDPDNVATTYYFQYGTSVAYGSSVPAAPGLAVGSGKGDVAESVHVQGLTPGTVYHYRVVALAEVGGEPLTVEGPDQTFATQSAGTEITQPDGRAWEMVSPPNKRGAAIDALGGNAQDLQASVEGGGITYSASAPFVANPAGSRTIENTQVISLRRAPGSWETADITTEHNEGASDVALGHATEYKLFSSDLSLGYVEPAGSTPLPPLPASEEGTIYLRKANGEYMALVSAANVPPGTKLENTERGHLVSFAGASPDLSHIVIVSEAQLTSTPIPSSALYEWAGGQLRLASVLPNGKAAEGADLGVGQNEIVRNAVSSDGSRLVWHYQNMSGNSIVDAHLDLRDMVRGETVAVDAAQGAPELEPGKQGRSLYSTASSDDSRVFFTNSERLTGDSTAKGRGSYEGEDLYVFEVTSGGGEPLAGKLKDLTVEGNAEETADVQGVIGASEDGSQIYFVASGVLGDGAGHGAVSGGNNLYVERYDAEAKAWAPPKFIATLSGGDAHSWQDGVGGRQFPYPIGMTSRVSPDGRYLAFMSQRSLTGYENRDANSGVPDEEVFLYDSSTGRIVCASCNPTGARPVGLHEGNKTFENLVDWAKLWENRWVAGNIPGWTPITLFGSVYQSRYLSDSGRLFFNSSDALVPADVNGREDVYEYEPVGVGGCRAPGYGQSASVVYSEGVGGCVGLISAGTSSEESAFEDASESGGDVFFLTLSKLAPQDYDTSIDLYDAHECTASAPCAPAAPLTPPPCTTGDACKPGPTPQPTLFGEPSSETFSGAGNIVPSVSRPAVKPKKSLRPRKCKRGFKKARGRCVKKAKRSARGRK